MGRRTGATQDPGRGVTDQESFRGRRRRAGQHDLRHRRVTTWIAEGRPVTLVREAVGYADLATTMRYTHLAKEHLRALVEEPSSGRMGGQGQVEG